MRCILLDDEPMALEVIKEFVEKVPFLEFQEAFRSPLKALEFLQKHPTDLLFLDINMPDLTGLQLLRSLEKQPLVILTTAYSSFAVESYELDVVDYLLKPIPFDRFLKAVNKAYQRHQEPKELTAVPTVSKEEEKEFTFVKSGNDLVKIPFTEVMWVEGAGNYLTFHLSSEKVMTLMTMDEAIQLLPADFARIHKSFIVSTRRIDKVERHQVWVGQNALPIGSTYREEFISRLGN